MKNLLLIASVVFGSAIIGLNTAIASCPSNQDEHCGPLGVGCVCVPRIGGVSIPLPLPNPGQTLPDLLNLPGQVLSGDVKAVTGSIGRVVIASSCTGCQELAQSILNKEDKAFVEQVVGRGFLLLASGADPGVVIADAASSAARYISLKKQQPPTVAPPPAIPVVALAAPRQLTITKATCRVIGSDGRIAFGWTALPNITNTADGKTSQAPRGIRSGDVVTVTSDDCPQLTQATTGQQSIQEAKMIFDYFHPVDDAADSQILWWLFGVRAP